MKVTLIVKKKMNRRNSCTAKQVYVLWCEIIYEQYETMSSVCFSYITCYNVYLLNRNLCDMR